MSGILLSFISIFIFSLMGVMVKVVSATIPTMEIVLFRSVITLIMIAAYMKFRKHAFEIYNLPLLALRGFFGGIGLLGFFYMLSEIKLAEAGIIYQMIPVFVVIMGWIFLKEKMTILYALLLLLSLCGAVLVIKPTLGIVNQLPALVGLVSALVAAGAYVCIKILSRQHNAYIIILFFAVGSIFVSFIPAAINFSMPQGVEWVLLVGIGISSALAQIAMTKAYSRERAGAVAMVGYVGVVFNLCWGYIFWGEVLDLYSWIGCFLILGASIALGHFRRKSS